MLIGIEIVKDRNTLERFDESARVTEHIAAAAMMLGCFFTPAALANTEMSSASARHLLSMCRRIELMETALGVALANLPRG